MKLLFLLPSIPGPSTSGARMRNDGLMRLAAEHHQVDALAFGEPGSDPGTLAQVTRRFRVCPGPLPRGRAMRLGQLASARRPDLVERFRSAAYADHVRWMLAQERYDAVQAEGLEMAQYLDLAPAGVARIYDAHNAEFLLQRRAFEQAVSRRNWSAAAYSLAQWRQLARLERGLIRSAQRTLAVSEHDANQIEALAEPSPPVHVVPNGIRVDHFPFALPEPHAEPNPNLLFVGTLSFRPNAEAVQWLLARVMPLVHAGCPTARLFVVGADPPEWLVRAGQHDDRVVVTGAVADERLYLRRASLMMLPLQVGGGSRLKALVAFASGLPVVSTRLGVEGLNLEPGRHALIADQPRAFADSVLTLLQQPGERQRLAEEARALVVAGYDWPRLAPALEAAYAGLG